MRRACKPLFENLPACTQEGGKFRVFPPLFDLNHRYFRDFQPKAAFVPGLPAVLAASPPYPPSPRLPHRIGPHLWGGEDASVKSLQDVRTGP